MRLYELMSLSLNPQYFVLEKFDCYLIGEQFMKMIYSNLIFLEFFRK